mmetsp:Transcript_41689/g.88830  ORF Transcript_41689/g.88830 Transcript_41689/m.88830 type:complete len:83 (-) Transcript_41689:239-487(-)
MIWNVNPRVTLQDWPLLWLCYCNDDDEDDSNSLLCHQPYQLSYRKTMARRMRNSSDEPKRTLRRLCRRGVLAAALLPMDPQR